MGLQPGMSWFHHEHAFQSGLLKSAASAIAGLSVGCLV